eukprot:jgi/Chlat1/911/Chrsp108S01353
MVTHRVAFRKLGRPTAHRLSMLKTMVSQLIEHERIETTVAKAKELRRVADQVVTMGKEGTLAARRRAAAVVRGDQNLQKLFTTGQRQGDGAHMAYIEYVDRDGELRPARPPRPPSMMQHTSILPPAAQPSTLPSSQ